MRSRSDGSVIQNYSARFAARPPAPPPLSQQRAASANASASAAPASAAFDDGAIPLSMSDDVPFVAANKPAHSKDDAVRARYLHKLRIAGPGGKANAKRSDDAVGKQSKPVRIKNNGWWRNTRRRKVSAPPPTTPELRAEGEAATSAAAAASAKPKADDGAIQLDLGMMFGEESPRVSRTQRYRSHSADSFDDDDSVGSPYHPSTHFTFVPPHELAGRSASVTDSDASSQL